ncbi:MAG: hypothetical protein IJI84_01480 [Clostridia bacterium]|nr:hypothetical protein [Clostridia bacterium]
MTFFKNLFYNKTKNLDPGNDSVLCEIKMFAEFAQGFQNLNKENAKKIKNEIKDIKKYKNIEKMYKDLEKFSRKAKDKSKQIFKKIESAKKSNKDCSKLIEQYASIRNEYFEKLNNLSPENSEDKFAKNIRIAYELAKEKSLCDSETLKIITILHTPFEK